MRVVTGGIPNIPGKTVHEKMVWLRENDDQLRKLMLREPRGYPPLCCNVIVPPCHPEADAGYVIMEQIEYPVMSGGNTISVATVLLEMGMLPMQEPVTELVLEAPAGLIRIRAECKDGKVKNVTFRNVPAFAAYLDTEIDVPHLGKVTVDVGWGGMFYVIADVRQFPWIELTPSMARK
ncbi:proline racemase family protein [Billgrantia tianxiuensis]|uniref:proline racemase family protein n=1 Tax=Billgrantia tianxiuensis TaxID=2497861 RepID=UPI00191566C5|nr:proline racemase family protein [Halomonas tianxiuensis]